MSIDRRQFLKVVLAGGVAVATCAPTTAQARENLPMPPKAMGLLYDSTLCIGCKACVAACKEANFEMINIGLESGSERVRRESLKRVYSNEQVVETVRETIARPSRRHRRQPRPHHPHRARCDQ